MHTPLNLPPTANGDHLSTKPLNLQRLLSRDEVESTFGISKRFLELAACNGDGPAFIKVGRLTRYRVQDLLDWILANRFQNTSQVDQRKDDL
jgi:hypothetical protein